MIKMTTMAARRLAVVLLMLGCAQVASAQTADEVIEKSLTALGGRAALGKLKSRMTSGTITLMTPAGDVSGTIEIWNAVPNKSRSLIKADLTSLGAGQLVLDQRFNGETGYALDSLQGNRDITGNQLDNLRNGAFPTPLLNYKQQGTSVTLGGKEKVATRDVYVLTFEPTAGSAVRMSIDAETYLPIRVVVKVNVPQLGQDLEQTSDFFDYREVDGIKIPFRLQASSAVQSYSIDIAKVEHNVSIDEALFSKPKPPQ